jgi:tRNA (guanine10-N2)-dimethyltransferase
VPGLSLIFRRHRFPLPGLEVIVQWLLHLSGAHPQLPQAEAEAAFASCGLPVRLETIGPRLLQATLLGAGEEAEQALRRALDRLGFTHEANRSLFVCAREQEALLEAARAHPEGVQDRDGQVLRFMVRAEYPAAAPAQGLGRQSTARVLGQAWSPPGIVDLEHPERVIRAWITESQVLVGEQAWQIDRAGFQARAPKNRPYFSPVSGHPVLMRAIANLARVPPGGLVYDPLVGTGGILLEAGLAGMRIVGSDSDPGMVQGARENLQRYGLDDHTLFLCDVREAAERFLLSTGRPHADGIVTDLPYGQSSTTAGADPAEVAHWTLQAASRLLPTGARLVIGTPQSQWLHGSGALGFMAEAQFDVRVHKSLTRSYFVLRRQ